MKRLTTLALVVFALAAIPAAFADDGSAPTRPVQDPSATSAQQQAPARPAQDPSAARPGQNLRHRLHMILRHCMQRPDATQEKCLAYVKRILNRLGKLDDGIQARIAKIQERCGVASTDDKCKNAGKRVERLQKVDTRVQTVQQKLQDWLDGKGTTTSAGADSALDQAANDLGQLAGSNG